VAGASWYGDKDKGEICLPFIQDPGLVDEAKKAGWLTRLYRRRGLSGPVAAVLLLGFLLTPLLPGKFPTIVATEILIVGLFALSFNLIYGYMGQISFGHGAFFGLGAYATALLLRYFQMSAGEVSYFGFFLAILAALPVSAFGSLIVGFFCIRLTGIYFAMLSLAFGELLFYIVFSWYSFTKGDDGIQGLMPPPFFQNSTHYYYFTLAIVVMAALLLWRITESPFGYTLRMLRDNRNRAAFLGINARRVMLMNFVTAGIFAGLAGALWGPFQRSVSPALLGWAESGKAVFMTLIGGAYFLVGPMAGSIIYTGLNAYVTRYTVFWPLTIGLIILLIVLFVPGGLLSVIDQRISRRGTERESRERIPPEAAPGPENEA
jgi:branched-chain amino acid transport system permease protein